MWDWLLRDDSLIWWLDNLMMKGDMVCRKWDVECWMLNFECRKCDVGGRGNWKLRGENGLYTGMNGWFDD